MHNGTNQPLIEVKDLKEYFNISMGMFKSKPLKAVDGVSFTINKGETLGLVGESGCGKTTVGRTILHLYKPTAGEIWYDGKKIETKADIHDFRKKATMVFQDPYSSLNPRMTVADIIGEPDVYKRQSQQKASGRFQWWWGSSYTPSRRKAHRRHHRGHSEALFGAGDGFRSVYQKRPRNQLREEWFHCARCLYHRGRKRRGRCYQVGQTEKRRWLDQS